MADADEDALLLAVTASPHPDSNSTHHTSSPAPPQDTVDLSDETQDFRLLYQLGSSSASTSTSTSGGQNAQHPTLPRRGEKDFEPHGTVAQDAALQESRAAMHAALSGPRVHPPKEHIRAVWYGGDLAAGIGWLGGGRRDEVVLVESQRGQHFRTMGRGDAKGGVRLLPEEALYLVERGNLDVRWPVPKPALGTEGEAEEESHGERAEGEGRGGEDVFGGLPWSLQAAYAMLIGRGGLTLERYCVYAGLKRSGYIVSRAPGWDAEAEEKEWPPPRQQDEKSNDLFDWRWLYDALFARREVPLPLGPLVRPGLYRSYGDIYRRLSIIPFHDPSLASIDSRRSSAERITIGDGELPSAPDSLSGPAPLRVCFHVWKPRPGFRKSAPGEPDFRIAVVDARESDTPSLEQLDSLLRTVPYAPPAAAQNAQLYQKLKHGWRHVTLAVVDTGVVSYLRVADAAFGMERLYERAEGRERGNKGRGGGRGGGGRGRGRGRGRGAGR